MVLNGTQSVLNATGEISSTGDKHAAYAANMKNIYQLQNGITNSDYPITGTVSRKSMVNGTSPYKNNSRLMQSNNKIINGSGSPRSSIASFTFTGTSTGYENGSARGRQSPTRQHVSFSFVSFKLANFIFSQIPQQVLQAKTALLLSE